MNRFFSNLFCTLRGVAVAAALVIGSSAAQADNGVSKVPLSKDSGLKALNPQPLPPEPPPDKLAAMKLKALNPQPLPPGPPPPPDKTVKRFVFKPGLLRIK